MAKRSPRPTDQYVGKRIRMQRMMKNMSQTVLGQHIGVTFQQVQKYELGTNRVGASRLQQISEALGAPISFFFDGAPGSTGTKQSRADLTGAPDIVGAFFTLPHARDLAETFVALASEHRIVVRDVAAALARGGATAARMTTKRKAA